MSYNTLAESGLAAEFPSADIQAALDTAERYLDAVYSARYPGVMVDPDAQDNLWPRENSAGYDLVDNNGRSLAGIVPDQIKAAEVVAARLVLNGETLLPNTVANASSVSTQNSQLIEDTVDADGVRSTQKWSPSSTTTTTTQVQSVNSMGLPIIAEIEAIMASLLSRGLGGSNYLFNRA